MARAKKDSIKFSSLIDRSLFKRMKEYSDESGIPITVILDKALKEYMEVVAPTQEQV